jgi:hypothetical protein
MARNLGNNLKVGSVGSAPFLLPESFISRHGMPLEKLKR